jgi:hypothetical protein
MWSAPSTAWAQTVTPAPQDSTGTDEEAPYAGSFEVLERAINNFWSETFSSARTAYQPPNVVDIDRVLDTGCGRHGPERVAFYCHTDQSIYLNPQFLSDQEVLVGDYAPVMVLAHEWGHHVQNLLDVDDPGGNTYELQADCLAGAFTRDAEDQGLLEPGDFLEALLMSESVGDPVWFPQDQPGAHGTYADRRNAVMRGFLDGSEGCNLKIGPQRTETPPPPPLECADLLSCLPVVLPLDHADCFGIVDDGTLNFEQLLGRFSGVQDAETRLQTWAWQASAFRQFGCDGPPEGEAGWIDISLHHFGDPLAAQEAVDYFAAVRAEGGPLFPVAPPPIGDHAAALSGPASNGKEFTIYASQGPLLVRVTGVSPSGIPFINVLTVTQALLATQQRQPQITPTPQVQSPSLPASSYLPAFPAVRHRDCFKILTEGTYTYGEVADALEPTGLSQSQFDVLGWRDGAYIVFACEEPPVGRAARIDVGIHQFQDVGSAEQALPYYSSMYESEDNEIRSCNSAGALVICVSGRSLSGSPLSDVQFVLQQVVDGAR